MEENRMSKVTEFSSQTIEKARELRLIDDALFRLVAKDKKVCQEILRTLLEDEDLIVIEVNTQYSVVSLNREITLDALCQLGDGTFCNIEMQKADNNNDIKRVRFHAALVTADKTKKGTSFEDIPNIKILYVTEYDALNNGRAITHVSRCQNINGKYVPLNDGEDIVFANTCCKDDTKQSKLLNLFLRSDSFYDDMFPETSHAMQYFKGTKEGEIEMCKSIEEYATNRSLDLAILTLNDCNVAEKDALHSLEKRFPEIDKEKIADRYHFLNSSELAIAN